MRVLISFLAAGLLACAAANADEADGYVDLWRLYQEARDADPKVLRAAAQVRSDQGRQREAFGRMLPQISINNSFNRSARDDEISHIEYNGRSHALTLSQSLYDPAVWRSYQKYSALMEKSSAESAESQIEAIGELADSYFAVLAAEDELSLVQAELNATERNLDRVNSLYARRMAMITDVLEIGARVDSLKAQLIEAQNDVSNSREKVAERVGRSISEPFRRLGENPPFVSLEHQQNYWVD